MFERNRLLAAVDLEHLATELLGAPGRGGTWACPEPTHAQTGRTPPVSIFRTRWGEQRWRCHGCGAGGTAIDLVMVATGRNVRDAMELLASTSRVVVEVDVPRPKPVPPDPRRLVELGEFVEVCAARLWLAEGRTVRRWLVDERCLPRETLEHNRVGADLGSYTARRPEGLPRGGVAAVFPAIADGRVVYAQLRRVRPPADQPRYLNAAASLAVNPRLTRIRPVTPGARPEIIVTEGPIDALSAASAGFRSVALLGAATSDELVARQLSRLQGRLVIAFDADEAGDRGATRLGALLSSLGRPSHRLELPDGCKDVNDWHRDAAAQWAAALTRAVDRAPEVDRSPRSIA